MKGAGGGKRGGRKPVRVEPDDRPRGYEATRMRQLWRDIDHAKRKAGLGPVPEPVAAPLFAAVLEQAATLAAGAAAWVIANAPTALALFASGAELLRGVPVVGRLIDLVPTPLAPGGVRDRPAAGSEGHANGHGRATADEVEVAALHESEPNGKWIQ
jgi:hypothetical protein